MNNRTHERLPGVEAVTTITLHFSPHRLPAMITRLTTYLLERQYGFLQTYHTPEHTEFEVFDTEERSVIHLTMKSAKETETRSMTQRVPVACRLMPAADHLLQHLLQREP